MISKSLPSTRSGCAAVFGQDHAQKKWSDVERRRFKDHDMLFLVISTPRPERPSDVAAARQSFWPWIEAYREKKVCRHIYPRIGRGAVAVFDVESNNDLHRILNEWADIIPAHFDTYPLVDTQATAQLLAAQMAAKK